MAQRKDYRVGVHGHQREQIDADLMSQIVIMMGRQLAREARGEAPDDDESLPSRIKRPAAAPDVEEQPA